jgi:hypothetical protein
MYETGRPTNALALGLALTACLFAGCAPAPLASDPDDEAEAAVIAASLGVADCPDGYTIIRGTSSANTLIGTAASDCILGMGGNDTIWGRGGDDYIAGGAGNDTIHGEGGNDALFGEKGADTIWGGAGADRIHGNDGNDWLYGDDGDDVIDGDAQADGIWGGNGDDVLYGDAGGDQLHGEAGDDALLGGAGSNTSDGGDDTDACSGANCEKPALTLSGCQLDSQCGAGERCIVDFGLCVGCVSDQDGDEICDSGDGCPTDGDKSAPGMCGCGIADGDGDADGTPDCHDGCAADAAKVEPGPCGCGVADSDGDADGTADCLDGCPADPAKVAAGACGCGVADSDTDADGTPDCHDGCPIDAAKVAPGVCGCGVADADGDADGTADCHDGCPADAAKVEPGECGCGVSDIDGDADGRPDCVDACPGFDDAADADGDGIPDGCDGPAGVTCVASASLASSAADIGLGDMDGDGDADAFVIGHGQDAVWLNDGAAAFTAGNPISMPFPSGGGVVEMEDLDADGNLDAVSTAPPGVSGPRGHILYGDGAGSLSLHQHFAAPPSGLAIADVTGDGALDTVFVDYDLQVRAGAVPPARGHTGVFSSIALPSGWGTSVSAGDFDGDGAAELLVGATSGIWYYDLAGDGTPLEERSISAFGGIAATADLNGDGLLDVVVADFALRVLLGTAPGSPQLDEAAVVYWLTGTPTDIELTDMNGDGGLDILLLTEQSLHIATFADALIELQRVPMASANSVSAADLDGDGDADIALGMSSGSSPLLLCHP